MVSFLAMFIFLIILHILASVLLILIVLFQVGKGAGLSNIFGGGPSGVFGASTSAFFTRLTSGVAAIFMLTSLYLSLIAHEKFARSSVKKILLKEQQQTPKK